MSSGSSSDWGVVGAVLNPVGFMGSLAATEKAKEIGEGIGAFVNGPEQVDTSGFMPGMGEQGLEQRLVAQAQGMGGPSVAELQMQAGMDQANKNAMALAASQRGINPGLAAALGQRQQGLNQVEANQQAGLLRAQESLSANQLLASLYSSQRGSAAQAAALQQQANNESQARKDKLVAGFGNAGLSLATMGGSGAAAAATPAAAASSGGSVSSQPYGYGTTTPTSTFGYQFAQGGMVPGQAKVKGDSGKNDTVPAMLSPGEMVIPRSIVKMGPDAISQFAMAIAAHGKTPKEAKAKEVKKNG